MSNIIQPQFASRPRTGMWLFEVYLVGDGGVRRITKMGRCQADALTQLIDELQDAPEVKRIDCTSLLPDDAVDVAETGAELELAGGAHCAFGAPGDWGYGRPIGAALAEYYREGRA